MNASTPQSAQEEALLQQVTDDRERRRAALRAAAESQAKQIVRSARAEARSTVHNAVIQERTRMDLGMRQAAAHADFEARRREWQKSRELLEQMWILIAGALERRWREPALRRAWIDAAIGQAAVLLPGRAWLIESGPNLTEQERGELIDRAQGRGAGTVKWSLQPEVPVGLRIRADNVCVDASVAGLLAQRDSIEAAFLAEYLPAPAPVATEKRTDG
jgi:hypothetical protein